MNGQETPMIEAVIGTTSRAVCTFQYHFTGKEALT
jgi:hypothetical protein